MIQRIQSVFLILVIASLICSVFFVFWVKSDQTSQEAVNMYAQEMVKLKLIDGEQKEVEKSGHIYLFILPLVAAGVAAYSLFQFKNRMRQMQLGALNSLLMAVTLGLVIWRSTVMDDLIPQATYDYPAFGFFSLVGAMIFNISSNRFIRRDEKLVKSMDRIR